MRALADHVAIVTAAAGDVGREMAIELARAGAGVVAADVDEAGLELTRRLAADVGAVRALTIDVSVEVQMAMLVDLAVQTFGKVTIMCNNPRMAHDGTVESLSLAQFDDALGANVRTAFLGCKYAVPALRAAGGGSIVNTMLSGGGRELCAATAAAVSRGAIAQLTRALAADHADEGIRVNCVVPAIGDDEAPRAVAAVATFLASDAAAFVSGSTLTLDGASEPSGAPRVRIETAAAAGL